jgi:polyisoprenoid-binding protein YceI
MSATVTNPLPDAASVGETKTSSYRIDPGASRFTVQAFAEGLLSAFGHSPHFDAGDLSGEVSMTPGDLATGSLDLNVRTASLRLTDDLSGKDRVEIERTMYDDVLEPSRYPEITFKGRATSAERIYDGFYRVTLTGQLSLHGTTREHSMETLVRMLSDGLRAEGDTQLRQSDFGIAPVSVAAGTLKVKDEVKLSFNIVAQAKA